MVQRIRWHSVESEIHAPKFTHRFTLGSQIYGTIKFVRNSYEFHLIVPHSPVFRSLTALKAFLYRFL